MKKGLGKKIVQRVLESFEGFEIYYLIVIVIASLFKF